MATSNDIKSSNTKRENALPRQTIHHYCSNRNAHPAVCMHRGRSSSENSVESSTENSAAHSTWRQSCSCIAADADEVKVEELDWDDRRNKQNELLQGLRKASTQVHPSDYLLTLHRPFSLSHQRAGTEKAWRCKETGIGRRGTAHQPPSEVPVLIQAAL